VKPTDEGFNHYKGIDVASGVKPFNLPLAPERKRATWRIGPDGAPGSWQFGGLDGPDEVRPIARHWGTLANLVSRDRVNELSPKFDTIGFCELPRGSP
jgi:hypothetical protein